MSNKTQLQTNNTALDGYIARINAAKEIAASLPEAGGGDSGGSSFDTCTVIIEPFGWDTSYERIYNVSATIIENGARTNYYYESSEDYGTHTTLAIQNVECGTTIQMIVSSYAGCNAYVEATETINVISCKYIARVDSSTDAIASIVFTAPMVNGETGTLHFSYEP